MSYIPKVSFGPAKGSSLDNGQLGPTKSEKSRLDPLVMYAQAKGVPPAQTAQKPPQLRPLSKDDLLRISIPENIISLESITERTMGGFANAEEIDAFLDRSRQESVAGLPDDKGQNKTIGQWLTEKRILEKAEVKALLAPALWKDIKLIKDPGRDPKKILASMQNFVKLLREGHAQINYFQRLKYLDQKRAAGTPITIAMDGQRLLEEQIMATRAILYKSYQNIFQAIQRITSDDIFANENLLDGACMLASYETNREKACESAIDRFKISIKEATQRNLTMIAGTVRSRLRDKWFQGVTSPVVSAAPAAQAAGSPGAPNANLANLYASSGPVPATQPNAGAPAPLQSEPPFQLLPQADLLRVSRTKGLTSPEIDLSPSGQFADSKAVDDFLTKSQIGVSITLTSPILPEGKDSVGDFLAINKRLTLLEVGQILEQLKKIKVIPDPGQDRSKILVSVQEYFLLNAVTHAQINYLQRLLALDLKSIARVGIIEIPQPSQEFLRKRIRETQEKLYQSYRNVMQAKLKFDPQSLSQDTEFAQRWFKSAMEQSAAAAVATTTPAQPTTVASAAPPTPSGGRSATVNVPLPLGNPLVALGKQLATVGRGIARELQLEKLIEKAAPGGQPPPASGLSSGPGAGSESRSKAAAGKQSAGTKLASSSSARPRATSNGVRQSADLEKAPVSITARSEKTSRFKIPGELRVALGLVNGALLQSSPPALGGRASGEAKNGHEKAAGDSPRNQVTSDSRGIVGGLHGHWHPLASLGKAFSSLYLPLGFEGGYLGKYLDQSVGSVEAQLGLGMSLYNFSIQTMLFRAGANSLMGGYADTGFGQFSGCARYGHWQGCLDYSQLETDQALSRGVETDELKMWRLSLARFFSP